MANPGLHAPIERRAPSLEVSVLEGCRAQDPKAFRAFVVRYQRPVFALLSRMLGHGPEIEDLAQETFVRAYRAFPEFDLDGAAKVSTWLLTIATRLALDTRKKKRFERADVEEADDATTGSTPEIALERRQLGRAMTAFAMTLPDEQRAVLVLVECHGLSLAEAAEALEIPENTVKTRLFRAREKMRTGLANEWRRP